MPIRKRNRKELQRAQEQARQATLDLAEAKNPDAAAPAPPEPAFDTPPELPEAERMEVWVRRAAAKLDRIQSEISRWMRARDRAEDWSSEQRAERKLDALDSSFRYWMTQANPVDADGNSILQPCRGFYRRGACPNHVVKSLVFETRGWCADCTHAWKTQTPTEPDPYAPEAPTRRSY